MKYLGAVFIVWVLALHCVAADVRTNGTSVSESKAPTPQQVLALIHAHGAENAIVLLDKSGAWQSSVLPGVESAHADWLTVARGLYPGTDAGGREELDDALSGALLKSPYIVLPLLQEIWWTEPRTVCTYDWDSELPGGVEQYIRRLRTALDKKPPAKLHLLRAACLRGIETTLQSVRSNKSK